MSLPLSDKKVSTLLVVLLMFGAVSAFCGAVLGIVFNGAGVPLEHLAGTPFSSFVVPGLILGVVVGGTQLAAGVALLTRSPRAPLMVAVAGFGMMIWIYTELALIGYSWLQSIYFGLGIVELILVLALLGIAPEFVSSWDRHRGRARSPEKSSETSPPTGVS
ncbi:hypothetical protein COCCU_14370 (plasmid) [Corynebacterium occultum]|uniref:Uncharacterized protein n=1 Tax=Corynebacterium occultum TaxID=2675219 RepID=A0A6B8W5E8_9CORY|nr:hypothetical protein [Corynebacterium occultum]QGU08764.1 hypothetical protein COCCU_14370 [Corynebacterium occultum]